MVVGDDRGLPVFVDAGTGGRLRVERRQPGNDAVQLLPARLAPVRYLIHHAVLGQAHHFQDIVHRVPLATHPHPVALNRNGQDLQVDFRAKPAVQDEFFRR